MLIQKSFKYELIPDGSTRLAFISFAGARRYVWNRALKQENYLGYVKTASFLPKWRKELHWLNAVSSIVLQQALMDLDKGFQNFSAKRAEHPKSKKKGKCTDSFRFANHFKIEESNNRIYLPKIGWVRYRNSRAMRGIPKNVTISRKGEKWYASIQTAFEVKEEPVHPSNSVVGLDLGIARFATLSDASFVEPLNAFKKSSGRLRRLQQKMARKIRFSSNWKKAKKKVTKTYETIANQRKDFLQKTSTTICKNHAVVVIENLKVKNMTASAAGTVAKPGKNVKQKRGLNRSILDQGWYAFKEMLAYKMVWANGKAIVVPAHYTSQTCPECSYIAAKNRKTQTSFSCLKCGYSAHADYVGARNILARGLAAMKEQGMDIFQIACAEPSPEVRVSWQEPTEAIACAA